MEDSARANALRAIIKKINKEVDQKLKGVKQADRVKREYVDVIIGIIDKYREQVKQLGFTHTEMIYHMGVINGSFIDRG